MSEENMDLAWDVNDNESLGYGQFPNLYNLLNFKSVSLVLTKKTLTNYTIRIIFGIFCV
jgi:hypothetical protein